MTRDEAKPSAWRMQHDAFVQTETVQAGVYVWQRHDGPALIDVLYDRRWIDSDRHEALSAYRNDLHLAGRWRSPVAVAYGRVTGGDQSDRAALAETRLVRADRHVVEMCWSRANELLRNVCMDVAVMPPHGPPPWLDGIRRISGQLMALRRG